MNTKEIMGEFMKDVLMNIKFNPPPNSSLGEFMLYAKGYTDCLNSVIQAADKTIQKGHDD